MDCRNLWGSNVNSTEANHGRTFCSYLNRRLDGLVEPTGKVVCLGMGYVDQLRRGGRFPCNLAGF